MSAPRTAAEVQEWKCGCRHTFEEHASNCRFFANLPTGVAEIAALLAANASIMEDLSMSACRCLTQQPLPHEGHCCLKDGWNPAADQLPDMHPDLIVCSHADEWAALHQVGGE